MLAIQTTNRKAVPLFFALNSAQNGQRTLWPWPYESVKPEKTTEDFLRLGCNV
jgi:hypothetical protein